MDKLTFTLKRITGSQSDLPSMRTFPNPTVARGNEGQCGPYFQGALQHIRELMNDPVEQCLMKSTSQQTTSESEMAQLRRTCRKAPMDALLSITTGI